MNINISDKLIRLSLKKHLLKNLRLFTINNAPTNLDTSYPTNGFFIKDPDKDTLYLRQHPWSKTSKICKFFNELNMNRVIEDIEILLDTYPNIQSSPSEITTWLSDIISLKTTEADGIPSASMTLNKIRKQVKQDL